MQSNTFSSLFIGQNLVSLESVDSTSNYLKRLLNLQEILLEGTLVIAQHQWAGRGQQGNIWDTPKGVNLTFSFLLKPSFLHIRDQFWLNKIICIGIQKGLSKWVPNVEIKWPNDIYFENKKIGGVLIETVLHGNNFKYAIIGIGINVNQEEFPPELHQAYSIKNIIRKKLDIYEVLQSICVSIEAFYLQLKSGNRKELNLLYLNLLLGLHQWRKFDIEQKIEDGKIIGISEEGKLQVQLKDGAIKLFGLQEIKFLF